MRMQVNGLQAEINTPAALTGDTIHGLPPHCQRPAYVVDEYKGCPSNWMHGSNKASSYFVPVEANVGMWFDFTMNATHTHHVAVVTSVQGINPITGQKVKLLHLEQYKQKCPKHNVDFQQDRFCPECKCKWPGQNYIATTTGQTLWIDGFRNDEGKVRQYIITEEEMRGIASQVIGDERVWAIGFAFYLSKDPKPTQQLINTRGIVYGNSAQYDCDSIVGTDTSQKFGFAGKYFSDDCISKSGLRAVGGNKVTCSTSPANFSSAPKKMRSGPSGQSALREVVKNLEVGAGAQIKQEIGYDPNQIDFWQKEPTGMIYVNYVPTKVANEILATGKREENTEGPLSGLSVGN